MENIIVESIFRSCDKKNTDLVRVHDLIEFIKPYMPNNLDELTKLKARLDPNDINPFINYSSFQRVMSDWVAQIQAEDGSNSLSEISVSVNLNQTFTSSISNDVKRSSNLSTEESEEVKNLKLQLHKATSELDLIKQQLAACEEQNELLLTELNVHFKKQNKEQCVSEHSSENECINKHHEENINEANQKYEYLERMLIKSDKLQQEYLGQISQLEAENHSLKSKLHALEKLKKEDRKSIGELGDCLDVKEIEIATLLEVIENLKCELDEKRDLLNFYTNECELSKQRIRDLELLLQNNSSCHTMTINHKAKESVKDIFNTPKLLNQLANPVTPTLRTPLLKGFNTSSPVKNTSLESGNGSSFDVFSNTSVFAMVTNSCKTLKEELAEIPYERIQKRDELDNLYRIVKDQEDIKNKLWHKMKKLCVDNEALLDYKKDYFDLILKLQEKDGFLEDMRCELESVKKKNLNLGQFRKQCENDEHIQLLIVELTNVENNLKQQRLLNTMVQQRMKLVSFTLNENMFETQNQCIQPFKKNIVRDQFVQTDEANVNWKIGRYISEESELKKTNFVKQQMKIERLLEKQERIEKELSNEKRINTKLSLKSQELFTENEKLTADLQSCYNNITEQSKISRALDYERNDLLRNVKVLRMEIVNLQNEIQRLERELGSAQNEKQIRDENLQTASSRLAVETTLNNNLRLENETFIKKQYQLEDKLKDEFMHKSSLKKYLEDLKVLHNTELRQLQDELIEKRTEVRTLKKQFEAFNLDFFLASCNEQLHRALLHFYNNFKFGDDWTGILPNIADLQKSNKDVMLSLENEMNALNTNIMLVVLFLRRISGAQEEESEIVHIQSPERTDGISLSEDESFESCVGEIPCNAQEIFEIITLEADSLLESLQFECIDYRRVSRREMDEKFATLALLLTVDVTTSKKRKVSEKEKLYKLILNFFSCLNYNAHLLSKLNDQFRKNECFKTIVTSLQQLKDVSEDMLKSAFDYGVLHYEKRTLDCWTFVINYVAILNKENKQIKEIRNTCKKDLKVHGDHSWFYINRSSSNVFRYKIIISAQRAFKV